MNYRATDKILAQLDRKLRIIFLLQPTNIATKQKRFLQQLNYEPQFHYPKIKIEHSLKTDHDEAVCLIKHELIHILSNENGRCQPYKIFASGLAIYLLAEEGIACYQESKLPYFPKRLWLFGLRALAVANATEQSFSQTFASLIKYGAPPQLAWQTTLHVKRGLTDTGRAGAFTKEHLYLFGYYFIQDYLKQNNKINDLMIGKISPQDLVLIRQLPDIKPSKYIL